MGYILICSSVRVTFPNGDGRNGAMGSLNIGQVGCTDTKTKIQKPWHHWKIMSYLGRSVGNKDTGRLWYVPTMYVSGDKNSRLLCYIYILYLTFVHIQHRQDTICFWYTYIIFLKCRHTASSNLFVGLCLQSDLHIPVTRLSAEWGCHTCPIVWFCS